MLKEVRVIRLTSEARMGTHSAALYLPFLLTLSLSLSAAQQSLPEAPKPNLPASNADTVIRSSVRLVQVSVVVEDKTGKPVTGLKQEDFILLDEGKPQHIAVFSAPAPPLAQPEEQAKSRSSLLPANAFTNRYDLKGQDPPGAVTVVLFDALNTAPQDQSFVRKEVIHFLETLKPQDHVAVYGLTSQLIVLHEFTRNSSDLVAAAERFTPKELAAFDASTTPEIDLVSLGADPQWAMLQNSLNNANGIIADQYTQNRVGITVAAMDAIASHISGIPGRKNLVWISGGLPIQMGMANIGRATYGGVSGVGDASTANRLTGSDRTAAKFDELLTEVADSLNRSNIAMYAIDAKGVVLDPTMDVSSRGPRLTNQVRDTSVLNAEQDTRDSAKLLADRTGGLAFFGNNDIRSAIRRAVDDGRYAYNIAFYPDHGVWDGKFRKIKIQAQAKEGLRLRYRSGYYAAPDRTDPKEVIAQDLHQAADSPLDATNLSMIITGKTGGADSRTVEFHIGIDPKQLLLHSSSDRRKGAVDLFFLQRDVSGKSVAAEEQHLELNLENKQYEYLSKVAMVLDRHVTLAPEATEIRVVLRDAASGSLGSVTVPTTALMAKDERNAAPTKPN
jgi:VWFA-related protein